MLANNVALVDRIFEECVDYSAFVGHTLCKHRLFLGLMSADAARLRLTDAAIWPLVPREVDRMVAATPTLFGLQLRSPKPARAIHDALESVGRARKALQGASDDAFVALKSSCERLRDGLRLFGDSVNDEYRAWEPAAVALALNGRDYAACRREVAESLMADALPVLSGLLKDPTPERYAAYWPMSADIGFACRVAVVASATEGVPSSGLSWISEVRAAVSGIERLVSCWSPAVSDERRPDFIAGSLRNLCVAAAPEAVGILERIATSVFRTQ